MEVKATDHHLNESLNVSEFKTIKLEKDYDETLIETDTNETIGDCEQERSDYQSSLTITENDHTTKEIKIESTDEIVEVLEQIKKEDEEVQSVEESVNTSDIHSLQNKYILNAVFEREFTEKEPADADGNTESFETEHDNYRIGIKQKKNFCQICNRTYSTKSAFNKHIKNHIRKNHCKCAKCGKEFLEQNTLINHMKIHYGKKVEADPNGNTESFETEHDNHRIGIKQKKNFCQICNRTYSTKSAFNKHIKNHIRKNHCKCAKCGKEFLEQNTLINHMKIHYGKKVEADPNGNTESFETEHDNHRIGINQRKNFCQICNRKYSSTSAFNKHMYNHDLKNQYKCSECGKEFLEQRTLTNHMKIHSGKTIESSSIYECTWKNCKRKFQRFSSFKFHFYVHTNGKPFKCSLCDASFRANHTLKRHLMRVHNTKQIGVKCHGCTAVFITEFALNNHIRNQHQESVTDTKTTKEKKTKSKDGIVEVLQEIESKDERLPSLEEEIDNAKSDAVPFQNKYFLNAVFEREFNKTEHDTKTTKGNKTKSKDEIVEVLQEIESKDDRLESVEEQIDNAKSHAVPFQNKYFLNAVFEREFNKTEHDTKTTKGNKTKSKDEIVEVLQEIESKGDRLESVEEQIDNAKSHAVPFQNKYFLNAVFEREFNKTEHTDLDNRTESFKTKMDNDAIGILQQNEIKEEADSAVKQIDHQLKQEIDTSTKLLLPCKWKNCKKVFRYLKSLKYHMKTHKHEKPFKCSKCYKCFESKTKFRRHAIIHGLRKIFACQICNRKYSHKSSLIIHMRIHTGKGLHKCSECGKEFVQERILKKHMDIHTRDKLKPRIPSKYKCNFANCRKEFPRLGSFKYHLLVHKNEKPFKCSICSITFRAKCTLKHHMLRVHTMQTGFKCHRCTAAFLTELGLSKHLSNHHPTSESSKSETFTKPPLACPWENCNKFFAEIKGLNYHINVHKNEKPFKCSKCEKSFRSKDNLRKHAKIHGIRKLLVCQICNNKYLNKHALCAHMKNHTGKVLHKCSQCSKSYAEKRSLRKHMRIHSEEEVEPIIAKYVCTWENCNRKFITSSKLQYHLLVHNNVKPFNCSLCDKSFRSIGILAQHIQRLHNTQQTGFNCHQCGAVFKTEINLTDHVCNHQEPVQAVKYECHHCNAIFTTKRGLTNHIRHHDASILKAPKTPHSESKTQFKCEFCDKKFLRLSGLKEHSRTHTDEKPFECTECHKKYSTEHNLSRHCQIHNQNKMLKIKEPESTNHYESLNQSICKEELILDEDL